MANSAADLGLGLDLDLDDHHDRWTDAFLADLAAEKLP